MAASGFRRLPLGGFGVSESKLVADVLVAYSVRSTTTRCQEDAFRVLGSLAH